MNELLQEIFHSNNQLVPFLIGVVLIFIIVSIVRSVFRMVLPFVVIGLVMVVFLGHSPDDVINKGKTIIIEGSDYIQGLFPFIQPGGGEKGGERSDTPPGLAPFSKEDLDRFLNGDENKETFEREESDVDLNKF